MSVYIQGINRPTEPKKCNFYQNDPLGIRLPYCALQLACYGLDKCPLIQVPDHGRLIDADALISHCKEMEQIEWNNKTAPYSWAYAYESLEDDIDNAKTIIPSDKDGE